MMRKFPNSLYLGHASYGFYSTYKKAEMHANTTLAILCIVLLVFGLKNWFMLYFRTSSSAREEKGLPDTVEELDAKYNVLPTSSQLLGFDV